MARYDQNNKNGYEEYIIEGIGSSTDFFELINFITTSDYSQYLVNYCLGENETCNQFPTIVKEVVEDVPVHIYPNPASDQLNFEVPDTYLVNQYEILDMLGQTIQNDVLGINSKLVPIEQLTSGWYVLLLHTDKNTLQKPFVINR